MLEIFCLDVFKSSGAHRREVWLERGARSTILSLIPSAATSSTMARMHKCERIARHDMAMQTKRNSTKSP